MPHLTTNQPAPETWSSSLALLTKAGDCLTYTAEEVPDWPAYKRLARNAHMRAKRHGYKVAVRRLADGGVSVWRIA